MRKKLMPTEQSYNRFLFTSIRKKSATIIKKDGADVLYTFGSVNEIIKCCSKLFTKECTEIDLTPQIKDGLETEIKKANAKALRTLGMAYKVLAPGEGGEDHFEIATGELYRVEQSGLTFCGFLGLKDPLREGVREAVKDMGVAGITVRMVTGDTKETATAIAKDCGILPEDHSDYIVMTGEEFNNRVGGKAFMCKSCEDRKAANKDANVINMEPTPEAEKVKVKEEKKEGGEKKAGDDDKACPVCKEKLQVTAKNMDEFNKIVNKLMVIAICRPEHKYLLVASLKYLYCDAFSNTFL